MKRFLPAAIAVVSAAIALPAHAEPQVYKDSDGGVYISGLVPKEVVKIAYGGRGQKIQVRPSGTCNVLKIPYKASEPGFYPWNQVDLYAAGTEDVVLSFSGANLASVDLVGKSLCAGTVRSTSFSWTALSGGAYGIREINNKAVYIVGLPYKLYEARDGLPAIRLQKANTCGFIKVSNTKTWPIAELNTFYFYANSYNGGEASGDYDPSALPIQNAHLCRKGVLYSPV